MKHIDSNAFELEFLNFVNHYVKDVGGKGPKRAEVRVAGDTLIYFLRGILTEREKELIKNPEGRRLVTETRRMFLDLNKENRMAAFQSFLDCEVIENYESWDFDNDSAVAVLVLNNKLF
ncbi:Na-translocating system protein MpsC family protein [Sporosarcina cascadiensis]|uniref:Na-translocating system protein MpsC family protein n=1 Tax=Sporosarcina cascadiensis TaxID=2660747 RepID=UPI00129B484A|nr:Na-translocating system protein MpsC family protein [Sporosarcina cascadiensis]